MLFPITVGNGGPVFLRFFNNSKSYRLEGFCGHKLPSSRDWNWFLAFKACSNSSEAEWNPWPLNTSWWLSAYQRVSVLSAAYQQKKHHTFSKIFHFCSRKNIKSFLSLWKLHHISDHCNLHVWSLSQHVEETTGIKLLLALLLMKIASHISSQSLYIEECTEIRWYYLDKYPTQDIAAINSQVNEQANAGLQIIEGQIAYMKP